jgi:8-oxo-dGTP pyrophosphatase MutT (NUDIX family)
MANGSENESCQSGALPVAGKRIVLITSRKSGRWIIPKGNVEKGLSPAESALKEAGEEAGVTGRVLHDPIGIYRYQRPGAQFTVEVFPLVVESILDEWQEMHVRKRKLVSIEDALRMLYHDDLRMLVAAYFGRPRR